jgi:hypothetical protein
VRPMRTRAQLMNRGSVSGFSLLGPRFVTRLNIGYRPNND